MAGFSTDTNQHLIRSNLWSAQLKEVLLDDLFATRYIDWITDFGDGDTLNIPSIGQAEAYNYAEGQAIKYTAMDTGNFTFSITEYKASATYIYNKMKQDSFYMSRLVSSFVPKQHRAIMEAVENDALAVGPNGQTSGNSNTINSAKHRFIGSGTNETIAIEDFSKALYALKKANVPATNLVAIVDPSVEVQFNNITNLVNFSAPSPKWDGIVSSGWATGMQFSRNIFGFDVYVSHHLKVNSASETIDSVTAAAGVNNLFFSATPDVLPFVGAIRQPAKVDSEYNKDLQRDEYVTTMRYGMKLFRPENLVCVVTDTDQVYV